MNKLVSLDRHLPFYNFCSEKELHSLCQCSTELYEKAGRANFFKEVLKDAGIKITPETPNYSKIIFSVINKPKKDNFIILLSFAKKILLTHPKYGSKIIGLVVNYNSKSVKLIIKQARQALNHQPQLAGMLLSTASTHLPNSLSFKYYLAKYRVRNLEIPLSDDEARSLLYAISTTAKRSLRFKCHYLLSVLFIENRNDRMTYEVAVKTLRSKNTPLSKIYLQWIGLHYNDLTLPSYEERFDIINTIKHPLADFLKGYMRYKKRTEKIDDETAQQLLESAANNQKIALRWRLKARYYLNCMAYKITGEQITPFENQKKQFKSIYDNLELIVNHPQTIPKDRSLAFLQQVLLIFTGDFEEFNQKDLYVNLTSCMNNESNLEEVRNQAKYYLAHFRDYVDESKALSYCQEILQSFYITNSLRIDCQLRIIALKLTLNQELLETEIELLDQLTSADEVVLTVNQDASAKLSLVIWRYQHFQDLDTAAQNLNMLKSIDPNSHIDYLMLKNIYLGLIKCYNGHPNEDELKSACAHFQEVIRHPRSHSKEKYLAMIEFAKITVSEIIRSNFEIAYDYLLEIEKQSTVPSSMKYEAMILRANFGYFRWTKLLTNQDTLSLCISLYENTDVLPPFRAQARLYAGLLLISSRFIVQIDGWRLIGTVANDEEAFRDDREQARDMLVHKPFCFIL